jgi:TRAP-type C4-dicarboxylate transport system permease small subunit
MSKTTRTGILTRLFPPDWELRLVLSLSIIFLLYLITTAIKAYQLSTTNVKRREALLRALGYQNDQEKKVIVGFFHPYW